MTGAAWLRSPPRWKRTRSVPPVRRDRLWRSGRCMMQCAARTPDRATRGTAARRRHYGHLRTRQRRGDGRGLSVIQGSTMGSIDDISPKPPKDGPPRPARSVSPRVRIALRGLVVTVAIIWVIVALVAGQVVISRVAFAPAPSPTPSPTPIPTPTATPTDVATPRPSQPQLLFPRRLPFRARPRRFRPPS
jgi:hypothetical protein